VYRQKVISFKRIAFRVAVVLLSISIIVYASLFFLLQSNYFRGWLQTQLKQKTGYELTVGDLRFRPPFKIVASTITVSKLTAPLFHGEKLTVTLTLFGLLSQSIHRVELEKPVLSVDLIEVLNSKSESKINLAIRHLNVRDGTVVIKTGDSHSFDLRAITVDADNLNIGETTGIALRAQLPWLNGEGDFLIRGNPTHMKAHIRIRQRPKKSLSLSGRQAETDDALQLQAVLRGAEGRERQLSIAGKLVGFAVGADRFSGDFNSLLEIEPSFNSVAYSAKFHLPTAPSSIGAMPLRVPAGAVTARSAGRFSVPEKILTVKHMRIESPWGNADGNGVIQFNPEASITNSELKFEKVSVSALKPLLPQPFGNFSDDDSIDAELSLQGPWHSIDMKGVARGSRMKFSSETIALQELAFTVPFEFVNSSLRLTNIQAQAQSMAMDRKDRLQARAEGLTFNGGLSTNANEPVNISGKLKVTGGRFATPDNDKVGENLAFGGDFRAIIGRADKRASFAGKMSIDSGEVLWGKFYADLKSQKPSVEFDGDYLHGRDEIHLRESHLNFSSVGSVAFSGAIEGVSQTPVFRLVAHSEDIQVPGAFEYFIKETFNRGFPILDKIIVGGRLGFSLRALGTIETLRAEGNLQLDAGAIRAKSDDWQFGPLDVALPFRIQLNGPAESSSTNPQTGTLALESARFGRESLAPFKAIVSFWDNSLRFHQPIRMTVAGGTVEISNLVWQDLLNRPSDVSFSMEMKNLQLLRLTEAMGWYRFGGSLSGSIPRVESVENSLKSQGEIQLNVFGGNVRIGKMEIENPFSSLPSVKLDARVTNVNLEQASETFAFGRISGSLDGTLDNLIITARQPSQFQADFHSVEKSGVGQRISVESLNKIAVLGSGNDAGAVYGGIAGLFDNFRYSKLGFKATLKNDKLILRGVESRDGQEYLVVGSFLPPTVNVISHTQEISFGELLRRLEQMRNIDTPQIK